MGKPKVLFVANIYEHIVSFHLPYIKWFKENGFEVHVAANELGDYCIPDADRLIEISIERNPFGCNNIKAIRRLKKIIEDERYDLISCHTPMGGVVARLAARKARNKFGLKVIYTSHGFHFFKGAPTKYWLLFYPIEKWLSRYTDAIVTINTEDYELVKTLGFKNEETYLIHGIGIDYTRLRIDNLSINDLRYKYGYKSDDFIMLYLAEFIPRKNHSFLINSMPKLIERIPKIKLILAGRGDDKEKMMLLAKRLGVEVYVDFIGFRDDVGNLIYISDIGVSSSSQEGLGMCLAESLYMGKPVVASDIRGHRDLVKSGNNGFLFSLDNEEQFIEQVVYMCNHLDERRTMGEFAAANIGDYVIDNTLNEMVDIYSKVL